MCQVKLLSSPKSPEVTDGDRKLHPAPHDFPFFFDQELMEEYQEYQKAYFDIYVMVLLFAFGVSFYFGRCNFLHPFDDGIFFACSLASNTCCFALYNIFFLAFMVKCWKIDEKSVFSRTASFILDASWLGDLFKDLIAVAGTFGVSFGLYGRVRNGQCAVDISLWDSQRCNPVANASALPIDHVIYLIILPLIVQSVANGMTYRGTFMCWIIGNIATILSIIHVMGRLEVWLMLSSMMILVMTYKHEKLSRVTFAHKKNTSAAEREKRKHMLLHQRAEHNLLSEKIKHELEILAIKSQEECRLMEKEQEQMVAMIGNIAHDLKTPLHSFLMDLESLMANQEFRDSLDTGPDGPASILQSLESTCCFMSMAINRSIDFAKASRNIALVPHMETLNMPEALETAVSMIRHLETFSDITVRPIPSTMCVNMITDKHWFKENILCLLSNAVKYSNGGIVTVTISHITSQMPHAQSLANIDVGNYVRPSGETSTIKGIFETDDAEVLYDSTTDVPAHEVLTGDITNSGLVSGIITPTNPEQVLVSRRLSSVVQAARADHIPHVTCLSSEPNDDSSVLISIEDGGIGISEKERAELFQPFKQAQRLAGGTGLGLYSLSNRIRALKGTRGVKSRDDGQQGSVFWFSFPYRPDLHADSSSSSTPTSNSRRSSTEGATTHPPSTASGTVSGIVSVPSPLTDLDSAASPPTDCSATPTDVVSTPPAKQPLRFLVVDDSSSILKVLCRALTNKKYEVETAANGSIGLNQLISAYANHDFDVVLMDLQMPVMEGIEAVRRYREYEVSARIKSKAESIRSSPRASIRGSGSHGSSFCSVSTSADCSSVTTVSGTRAPSPNRRDVFIIGMSANSDEDTKQCALNAGMNTFLAKPFSMAELLPILHHMNLN